MAYADPVTHVAGDVFPSADWNSYIRDNFRFLHDQGADLVAAATITPTTQFHKVTGSTTISAITILAAGARLRLFFTGTPALVHTASGGAANSLVLLATAAYQVQANEVLEFVSDGTQWRQQSGSVYSTVMRKTSSKTVNTSVTETDLLNAEFSLAAGALGTNRRLRLVAWGNWLQNSGANQALPQFKLKLGATVIFDSGVPPGPATSAIGRLGWQLTADIFNKGATNSQIAAMNMRFAAAPSAPAITNGGSGFTAGFGPGSVNVFNNGWLVDYVGENAQAIDTTAALALTFTVINAVNNALYEVVLAGAFAVIE